jgi:2-iminoacetate synthase
MKNQAEAVVFTTEKMIKESGDKMKAEDKTELEAKVEELKKEVEVLAGVIGHKRLIIVYGEHPLNDIDKIVSNIKTIYDVSVKKNKNYVIKM